MASILLEWVRYLPEVGLLLCLLLFWILKQYAFTFTTGDEHLYNAMSLSILEGQWPYRDFFHSHPPLPVYVTAGIFALVGYSIAAAKIVPALAALSSGLHVFLIGKRSFGKAEGLIAAALFLFTFDVIRGSSHPTGANLTLALLLAGTYQVMIARALTGGVLLGLSILAGVYALPMALMLAVLVALRSRRQALRFTAAAACVVLGVALVFTLATGAAFFDQVVVFNWNKEPMRHSWFDKFENVFFLNFHLMSGFVAALFWGIARWAVDGRRGVPAPVESRLPDALRRVAIWANVWGPDRVGGALRMAIFAFGYLFFYSNLKVYFSYYFMLIMPFMGLLTAYVTVDVGRVLVYRAAALFGVALPGASIGGVEVVEDAASGSDGLIEPKKERAPRSRQERRAAERRAKKEAKKREKAAAEDTRAKPSIRTRPVWPVVVALVGLAVMVRYRDVIGEQRIERYGTRARHYAYPRSPRLADGVESVLESLFWTPLRDRLHPPRSVARYLQHETVHLRDLDGLVELFRGACRPGDTIFGEYTLHPFAAAVSECRVGAGLIDTNSSRIHAGESTLEGWIAALEADDLDLVVLRRPSWLLRQDEFRTWALGEFPIVEGRYSDPYLGRVEVRRRRAP